MDLLSSNSRTVASPHAHKARSTCFSRGPSLRSATVAVLSQRIIESVSRTVAYCNRLNTTIRENLKKAVDRVIQSPRGPILLNYIPAGRKLHFFVFVL